MGDDMSRERRWDIDDRGRGTCEPRMTPANPGPDGVRAEAFRVLGSFAEHTTHMRQRSTEHSTEYEIATGTTEDETPFRRHGHLVLLRVRPG